MILTTSEAVRQIGDFFVSVARLPGADPQRSPAR